MFKTVIIRTAQPAIITASIGTWGTIMYRLIIAKPIIKDTITPVNQVRNFNKLFLILVFSSVIFTLSFYPIL